MCKSTVVFRFVCEGVDSNLGDVEGSLNGNFEAFAVSLCLKTMYYTNEKFALSNELKMHYKCFN